MKNGYEVVPVVKSYHNILYTCIISAGAGHLDNHRAPIVCITPISTTSAHHHHLDVSGGSHGNEREIHNVTSGLSFQLATLDR